MEKGNATKVIFGTIFGGVLFAVVGFSMGWIVTSGNAEAAATSMSDQAVKDQLVPICMYQFRNLDDSEGKLVSLRNVREWERGDYIEKQGWAMMPGSDTTVKGVARECAARLTAKAP